MKKNHEKIIPPSEWVKKFAHLVPNGPVLDLAAGRGRHTILFDQLGHTVTAIDKDISLLNSIKNKNIEVLEADLETNTSIFSKGALLEGRKFSGIIVVNYLHRPLLKSLLSSLQPKGTLIYETFSMGNELFSRPRNPKHLLRPGELVDLVKNKLQIVAFEQGIVNTAISMSVKQRIVAINDLYSCDLNKSNPKPHTLF